MTGIDPCVVISGALPVTQTAFDIRGRQIGAISLEIKKVTMFIRSIALVLLASFPVISVSCRSSSGPPYSPDAALETFQIAEPFRIELVAAEPEVADPVAISFDGNGRMYVVEMADYPMGDTTDGRIRRLEDRDGDGYYETSAIFADGLQFPTSAMPWKEGILVTSAPDILYLVDTDGDGKADKREVVLTGFNPFNPQLRANGLLYGIDNWIYGAYPKVGPSRRHPEKFGQPGEPLHFPGKPGMQPVDISELGMDFRFKPHDFIVEPAPGNSQFGNAFDASGNRFMLWNSNHIRHSVIAYRYLTRNPYLSVPSAMEFPSDHENQSKVFPITEQPIYMHESQVGQFTSACGNSVYTGGKFPERYESVYFVCEPVHNLVHADLLTPRGATFVASRALENREFLASTDPWFKPVFTTVSPDGGLYVVDYYRKYVEHPDYVPEGLEGEFDLRTGEGMGRIYRILPEGATRNAVPNLQELPAANLVQTLNHSNLWWRTTAQRLLVERQERSVAEQLRQLATGASSAYTRIHALWTLQGLGELEAGDVSVALEDSSPLVREHAVRLTEQFNDPQLHSKLLSMADDPSDRVQFQLACTLGDLPSSESFQPLLEIALRHVEDEWYQIAVLTAASENALQWYRALVDDKAFQEESEGKAQFLTRVTSIMGTRRNPGEIEATLSIVRRGSGDWWKSASLEGLSDGLDRASGDRIILSESAQNHLVALLSDSSARVVDSALGVAESIHWSSTLPLERRVKAAEDRLAGPEQELEDRLNDVRILGLAQSDETIAPLSRLLSPQEPTEVQRAAAQALLQKGSEKAIRAALANWSSHSAAVRDVIWNGLLTSPTHLNLFLDDVEAGTIPVRSVERSRVTQLTEYRDETLRARANTIFAGVVVDRSAVIERYLPAIEMDGDPEKGKQVYLDHCSACHQLGEMGVEVGPDLLNLARRRSKSYFLNQILDPSADISPGYETYIIETRDGATYSGVVAEESPTAITLKRRDAASDTILRSEIESLRVSTLSTMPEDLEIAVSIEDMAHLLEYLETLRTPGPQ